MPEKAWYITDWDDLYEVNSKGGRWKMGDDKRVRPLEFVRLWVYGPAGDNQAYSEVAELAESIEPGSWPIAWGLFIKLLEVTARQYADFRGYLLGRGRSRLSGNSGGTLLRITCFSQEQIELGFRILTDPRIGWIEERELPVDKPSSGNSGALNKTEAETEEEVEVQTETESAAENGEPPKESGERDSPSSVSESEQPDSFPMGALLWTQKLIIALEPHYRDHTDGKLKADMNCFRSAHVAICEHKQAPEILDAVMAKAAQIKADPNVSHINRPKVLTAWLKKQLQAKDIDWGNGGIK